MNNGAAMFVMRSQFDDRRMDDFTFFMPVMPATILRPKAIFTIRRNFGESWLWDDLIVGLVFLFSSVILSHAP